MSNRVTSHTVNMSPKRTIGGSMCKHVDVSYHDNNVFCHECGLICQYTEDWYKIN